MARSLKEWVGRTDDSKIPGDVRDRVFERVGRVCHLCQQVIEAPGETWDMDHVKALINGGENREGNLAPAHKHCHVAKSALDVKEKSKVARVRKKHIGITQPAGNIPTKGFQPPSKTERASRHDWAPKLKSQLFAAKEQT